MVQEVQLVKCPVCGTPGVPGDYCEMGCGRLAATRSNAVPAAPEAVPAPRPAASPSVLPDAGATTMFPVRPVGGLGGDLVLERDELCVFFEGMTGMMRFRIMACRRLEAVMIAMQHQITGEKLTSRRVGFMEKGTKREIGVSVPGHAAGAAVWILSVEYVVDGRRRVLEGEAPVVSLKPREAQMAAENLSVTINSNITNGNASDVVVSQRAVEDLAHLAHAENPFEELRKIVQGTQRAWILTSLDRSGAMEPLPPMPLRAATDRLMLDLGTGKLHLRVGRTLTIGRSRSKCDITMKPPKDATQAESDQFLQISRRHCQFMPRGDQVVAMDGYRDGLRGTQPSRWGTFWDGTPIAGARTLKAGEEGILSFVGPAPVADGRSFKAKVCRSCGICSSCSLTDRDWCGNGRYPCLLLTLRGKQPEAYLALWGCFGLGEADPAFDGITIFREREGFAWRQGRSCGWLVPDTVLETDSGMLRVCGDERPPSRRMR